MAPVLASKFKCSLSGINLRPLVAGEVIGGRYALKRLIGAGGMGEVWLARHQNLHVDVALKFLSLEADVEQAVKAQARSLFCREAQVSAQLCALTPHIVRVHDAGIDASRYFLAMEYVAGHSLAQVILEAPVTLDVIASILDQISAALDVAHENGVVHRDVKPGNILLGHDHDGKLEAKLADFGIAEVGASTLSGAELVVGTPEYMSPEQFAGGDLDGRSDVWALGVVTYEALTGISPFGALAETTTFPDTMPELEWAPPSWFVPELPSSLDRWFEKVFARNRDDRFQSAGECARALRACIDTVAPKQTLRSETPDVMAESAHLETPHHLKAPHPIETPTKSEDHPHFETAHHEATPPLTCELSLYDPASADAARTRVFSRKGTRTRKGWELAVVFLAAVSSALLAKGIVSLTVHPANAQAALVNPHVLSIPTSWIHQTAVPSISVEREHAAANVKTAPPASSESPSASSKAEPPIAPPRRRVIAIQPKPTLDEPIDLRFNPTTL